MNQDFFVLIAIIIFFYFARRIAKREQTSRSKKRYEDLNPIILDTNIARNNYKMGESKHEQENGLHGHRCYIDDGVTDYELKIIKHLAKHLDPIDYYLFNNVTVSSSHTITTQIDHIVVSKYGIFVIENKDFSGWIFGNKDRKLWTQTLPGKKSQFQNPIIQNFTHISALKEHLPFLKKVFYNIVVFSEESEFKTPMPPNVMYGRNLIHYMENKKRVIISEPELLMTIGKLSMLCQTCFNLKEEHMRNLELLHGTK